MRIGSLVFATEQGLGYLAKAFYDHNILTDVLVIRHGKRKERDDWYPESQRVYDLARQVPLLRSFCQSMDAMLFFETPFVWELLPFCREVGVKTFLMPMHECMPDPLPALPDAFICPSLLDLDCYKNKLPTTWDKGIVPATFIPIPVEVPWRLRERAEVFIHNAGNGGLKGRNGTAELWEAMRYVQSPSMIIFRSQVPLNLRPHQQLIVPKVIQLEGTVHSSELYSEGDVFIFPEKFNGLSLPLQEARAAGMLVMSTDRFPINTWLPQEPLIPVRSYQRSKVSPRCLEFDEAQVDPKTIAKSIDSWYGKDISSYSLQGKAWAEENSWEKLKPKYLEVLSS